MQFVIRTDIPFPGQAESILKQDGTIAWTDGLTFDQYAAQAKFPVRIIDSQEYDTLIRDFAASLKTAPEEETENDFQYALQCLPPCRWRRVAGVELFHISERITHNLVRWHARVGNRCFHFIDEDNADMNKLAAAVSAKISGS